MPKLCRAFKILLIQLGVQNIRKIIRLLMFWFLKHLMLWSDKVFYHTVLFFKIVLYYRIKSIEQFILYRNPTLLILHNLQIFNYLSLASSFYINLNTVEMIENSDNYLNFVRQTNKSNIQKHNKMF